MRILLVNDYGSATGGAEVVLLDLRDELRRRGHEVRLFSSSARTLGVAPEADGTGFGTVGRWRTLVQSANPAAARALDRELATFDPEVVHVRSYLTQLSPLILPHLERRAAVLHLLDYRSACPRSSKQLPDGRPCFARAGRACLREGCVPLRDWPFLELQRRLDRTRRGVFDRVVANSEWVAARLRPFGIETDEVVWNGVPVSAHRAVEAEATPVITFAGRVVPEKGLDVLIPAFAHLLQEFHDARLVIAGDGPAMPAVRSLASKLRVSEAVTFLGHVDRCQLEDQLASGTIHVVPSTWEEPFGRSAAEALMRGQALVASDVGGLGELARASGSAVSIPPGDSAALAGTLAQLLRDPSERFRRARAGHAFALRELTIERFAERFTSVYELACAAVRA